MERKRILVTGGAGFISSNMIRYLLGDTEHEVVTMDALTYAGNLANLDDVIDHDRLRFIKGDIRDVRDVSEALDGVDVIVNAAAES
ncbi:MAG TPA: NAD-dependent epimerase/dehydratase family protein, partial [Gaiellales bacterium]|nr:NAD-dependent epimerase/dehydratase family protein [Gaiellales bacterium]